MVEIKNGNPEKTEGCGRGWREINDFHGVEHFGISEGKEGLKCF